MYCERCNVDFPEGLRYCKWCGQTLVPRPQGGYELQSCPTCAAPVQPNWAFCKACGVKLNRATRIDAEPPAPRITTGPVGFIHCMVCGEQVESGAPYCKACGSPVEAAPEPFSSSLLCEKCNSYSPVGSTECRVCGAQFTHGVSPVSEPQKESNTLLDLTEHASLLQDAGQPGATIERSSLPAAGGSSDTWALVTDNLVRGNEAPPLTEPAPVAPVDAPGQEPVRATVETSLLPGSGSEQQASTGSLNKKKTTGPVDEGPPAADDGAATLYQLNSDPLATVVDLNIAPHGLMESGPSDSPEAKGPIIPGGTLVFGSEFSEAAPPDDQIKGTQETAGPGIPPTQVTPMPRGFEVWQSSPPDSTTDLAHTRIAPVENQVKPTAEVSADRHTSSTRIVEPSAAEQPWRPQPAPPTRGGLPPTVAPQLPAAKKSAAPLIAMAAVVAVLAAAAVAGWWVLSGPAPPTPQVNTTDTPQPTPAPPPPGNTPPPPPAPPEGMVMVAGGTYTIGRNDGDELERPEHKVTLPAFFIDRTEVTNAAYKKFVDATAHRAPDGWKDGAYAAGQDDWPVTGVSWQDAADFAAWSGKRLPTEEEWEAAARGGEGRAYPWGNEWKTGLANIGTKGITAVGQFPEAASPVGALDMIGNVWEWTADEFDLYPGSTVPMPPNIDSSLTYRVMRGGAYDGNKIHAGSYRGYLDASKGWPRVGFRCVKDAK